MAPKSLERRNSHKKNIPRETLNYLIEHTKYNKQEIKEWYRKFLEECPTGVLSKEDLHQMYERILPKEDPTVIIDHLFRIFDRDNNGSIDFKEFVMATDITTSGAPEEKLRWTFKMYDKDGSGTIELSEMIEVLETVYIMEGVTSGNMAKKRAEALFAELDVNGDGSLSCEEFIRGCMDDKEMLAMLKRDHVPEGEDCEPVDPQVQADNPDNNQEPVVKEKEHHKSRKKSVKKKHADGEKQKRDNRQK